MVALGVGAEDRAGEAAGDFAVLDFQRIAVILIEAAEFGYALGEPCETARYEGRAAVVFAHGLHEFARAFGQCDGSPDVFKDGGRFSGQKRHALLKGCFEIQLTVHRGTGNGGDVFATTQQIRQFVERLARDDGAVHVGDEDGPAAATRFQKQGIDAIGREGCADGGGAGRAGTRRRAGNIHRFARRQDDGRIAFDERPGHVDGLGFEGAGFPVSDKGQDGRKGHGIS